MDREGACLSWPRLSGGGVEWREGSVLSLWPLASSALEAPAALVPETRVPSGRGWWVSLPIVPPGGRQWGHIFP